MLEDFDKTVLGLEDLRVQHSRAWVFGVVATNANHPQSCFALHAYLSKSRHMIFGLCS
jgi:hypothetical protein